MLINLHPCTYSSNIILASTNHIRVGKQKLDLWRLLLFQVSDLVWAILPLLTEPSEHLKNTEYHKDSSPCTSPAGRVCANKFWRPLPKCFRIPNTNPTSPYLACKTCRLHSSAILGSKSVDWMISEFWGQLCILSIFSHPKKIKIDPSFILLQTVLHLFQKNFGSNRRCEAPARTPDQSDSTTWGSPENVGMHWCSAIMALLRNDSLWRSNRAPADGRDLQLEFQKARRDRFLFRPCGGELGCFGL